MTKADLIEAVADGAELRKREAAHVIDVVLREIEKALRRGERVALMPFGSFFVRDRKAREGRNPKTGEKIEISARKVPAFLAGKALKDSIGRTGAAQKRAHR
ncbi:MAG TPA: HU family DNA-binding protein [Candidatus Acidoferrum sp.]|nr:HU family DNA-binding protein [Candidatus Acidoferrum sp.]